MPFLPDRKELGAGGMFLGFGAAALGLARELPMGTAVRMGPGYFPTVLGGLLALVGAAVIARAVLRGLRASPADGAGEPGSATAAGAAPAPPSAGREPPFAWRPLILVTAATAAFGILLRGAGLVPATMVLVIGSAWASPRFSFRTAVPLAVGSAIFCALVFVKALGVPLPIFGSWFGE
jgi:hypothetical protein